ncbi:MAG: 2-oxoglutarate dehydrogenase E1 component [Candidatus Binatia bacterium]|nr:2-oxoglutarate dehydrogenase E1 component [Candidatus Binatia bacterium]
MSTPDFVNRANAEFIDQLQEQYQQDPESVDPTWRAFFQGLELGRNEAGGGDPVHAPTVATSPLSSGTTPRPRTFGLVHGYRDLGHLLANVDPLSDPPEWHPLLDLGQYSLREEDLSRPCEPGGLHGEPPATLGDLVTALKETYCGTMGVEFTGIRDSEQRGWLEDRMEPTRNRPNLTREDKLQIFTKLVEAETFEQFLHKKFPGQKRFSLEGGDTLIPMLESLIEEGANQDVEQVVLGMAHRGRLNVLANVVRKPYEMILAEFEGSLLPDWVQGDGDVKYHQGYSRDHHTREGQVVHVSLTPNPSHLEAVNPVVEGKVRAKQNLLGDKARRRVMPVLAHGDAAFIGQGVVPETLLLSHLPGYFTGGTIHVVINNQVGFTTSPEASRPTRYTTDIARIIESPVFHVNADDPEMAVHAIRLAVGFRQRFKRDAVIDLTCYRKHGHNETDEPTFTQPVMYGRIAKHPGTRDIYEKQLIAEGSFTGAELAAIHREVREVLDLALDYAREFRPRQEVFSFGDAWKGLGPASDDRGAETKVSAELLTDIARRAGEVPESHIPHPKVAKVYHDRIEMIGRGKGIDFGCAEMLSFGALLRQGTPIRLAGQDSRRGTFSHRHSVVYDQETGVPHTPLNAITAEGEAQARFEVIDSPLSEEAALGFEYGFSSAAPETLCIWEAQFGDFANGAQIMIDSFIAAGESKWQRASGLVLYLPHGYEGQGPEHSSARLERFLQLCGDDNLQVVQPTTAAQLFHLLRRQMLRGFRKPLVVMSPKSLLRFKPATSALQDLTEGRFEPLLADPVTLEEKEVRTIAFCSGKVFYEIAKARQDRADLGVTALRVEELYPLPETEIRKALDRYPNANDIVWVQDEPINMGAWWYISQKLPSVLDGRPLRYAGRDDAASPAAGSYAVHVREQNALVASIFDGPPTPARLEPARKKRAQAGTKTPKRAEAGGS